MPPEGTAAPAASTSPAASITTGTPTAAAAVPGTPGPGATAAAAAPTSTPAPTMPEGAWYKDWAPELHPIGAKYKDVQALASGYANLQSLHGQITGGKTVVPVPGADATPEQWGEFYGKTGRPAAATEYKIAVPEGQPDTLAKAVAPSLFEAGLSQRQVDKVVEGYNGAVAAELVAAETAFQEKGKAEFEQVKQAWGDKFNYNSQAIQRLGAETGLSVKGEDGLTGFDKIERAIGTKTMLELFAKMGAPLMDDSFTGHDGAGSAKNFAVPLSPAEAEAEMRSRGNDKEWLARLANNDPKTVEERDRLSAAKMGLSLADYRTMQANAKAELDGSAARARRRV